MGFPLPVPEKPPEPVALSVQSSADAVPPSSLMTCLRRVRFGRRVLVIVHSMALSASGTVTLIVVISSPVATTTPGLSHVPMPRAMQGMSSMH